MKAVVLKKGYASRTNYSLTKKKKDYSIQYWSPVKKQMFANSELQLFWLPKQLSKSYKNSNSNPPLSFFVLKLLCMIYVCLQNYVEVFEHLLL